MNAWATDAESGSTARIPAIVWVLIVIFALRALLSVVGSVIFAFPMGGVGTAVGIFLLVVGVAYAVIAWRMRFGERWVWVAALVVSLLNQGTLAVLDLALFGRIPSEDYLFIGVTIVVVILLLLPSTRRFFSR